MDERDPKSGSAGAERTERSSASDDACRCKETANMTPRELLRLMMRDLTFWKKETKK